jgi:hypothetical protein
MNKRILAERIAHEHDLREAAAKAVDHERELRLVADTHERELRLVAEAAVERARVIQFNEYERRLDALNHAHDQAVAEQLRTLPRTEFDQFKRDLTDRTDLASREQDNKHQAICKSLDLLERTLTGRFESAITGLNEKGTQGYRVEHSEEVGRASAQKEIMASSAINRRWLIGLAAGMTLSLATTLISLFGLLTHSLG